MPYEELKKEKWQPGCLVKDRNEPASIAQVLQVLTAARVAGGKNTGRDASLSASRRDASSAAASSPHEAEVAVAAAAFANSVRLFRLA